MIRIFLGCHLLHLCSG